VAFGASSFVSVSVAVFEAPGAGAWAAGFAGQAEAVYGSEFGVLCSDGQSEEVDADHLLSLFFAVIHCEGVGEETYSRATELCNRERSPLRISGASV